jgi:hypothetical protein
MGIGLAAVLGGMIGFASIAQADPRPFTFVSDTYPIGKGNAEFEQYVTYRGQKADEKGYTRFDFAHEIEYGVAENFDVSVYLAKWRYEDTDAHTGTQFDSFAVEGILYLSSPFTDPVGIGIYNELNIGEGSMELEHKLLVQKDINDWTFAYNLVAETEIEGIFDEGPAEVSGTLENAFGVSYTVGKVWHVGGEAVVASGFDNWNDYTHTTVYAGPVVSYQGGEIGKMGWWVTVTPTIQLTQEDSEPDYKVRLIAGLEF